MLLRAVLQYNVSTSHILFYQFENITLRRDCLSFAKLPKGSTHKRDLGSGCVVWGAPPVAPHGQMRGSKIVTSSLAILLMPHPEWLVGEEPLPLTPRPSRCNECR